MDHWFMLHKGNQHHMIDEGLYLHYEDTCNVHDTNEVISAKSVWAARETSIADTRLCPSHHGWVAINYETKGVITFFVQLNANRAAWQRIEWPADFDKNWDDDMVRNAVNNFLWIAECEDAKKVLAKK